MDPSSDRNRRMEQVRYSLPWLVGVGLALSACTAAGQPTTDTTVETTTTVSSGFPIEISGVEIPERPERIVSLSATHTEILFAIGAGDQVVAGDRFSDHPPEAADLPQLDSFQPNVEAIAEMEPDLVVANFDPGDLAASLEALEIPVLLFATPEDLDGVYGQIDQVGAATGHLAEAAALVADMSAEIERLGEEASAAGGLTYYLELDSTFFTVTSETFVGDVLSVLGLENISDAVADNPYPQLSAEYIIEADPGLVLLAHPEATPDSVAARPGWSELTAVQTGAVIQLDPDLAARWGPRLVELARTVTQAIESLQPVGG